MPDADEWSIYTPNKLFEILKGKRNYISRFATPVTVVSNPANFSSSGARGSCPAQDHFRQAFHRAQMLHPSMAPADIDSGPDDELFRRYSDIELDSMSRGYGADEEPPKGWEP